MPYLKSDDLSLHEITTKQITHNFNTFSFVIISNNYFFESTPTSFILEHKEC